MWARSSARGALGGDPSGLLVAIRTVRALDSSPR
jgi:hypothetical protein